MAIIINYAVGTGILNLPHTLAAASIGVSLILMAIVTFTTYLLGQYALDVLSKTYALKRAGFFKGLNDEAEQLLEEDDEEKYTEKNAQTQDDIQATSETNKKPVFWFPNNFVLQMTQLCELYYGKVGFYGFQIVLIIYFFGTVWGCTQVVASSMTSVIPFTSNWDCSNTETYTSDCNYAYIGWSGITMVISVILIFFNLADQKVLQAIFTYCRFILLGLTCVLIVYCLSTQPFLPANEYSGNNYIDPQTQWWGFNVQNVGAVFSSITFSQIYHHSLPGIFQPVDKKYQTNLNGSLIAVALLLVVISVVIALPGALYFGNNGTNLVTLNFAQWDGNGFNVAGEQQPLYCQIIAYIVQLLAPIYVITSIPINGLTMALNILQMLPSRYKNMKIIEVIIKLLCLIPAMLLGMFVRDLGSIISFTGLMGFLLLIAPTVCLLKAQKQCQKVFGVNNNSPFALVLAKPWIMSVIIVFNLVGFVLTAYSLIAGLV